MPADDAAVGGFAIRPAAPDDAEGIARVQTATWKTTYRGLIPDAYLDGLSVEKRRQNWAGAIAEMRAGQACREVAFGWDISELIAALRSRAGRDSAKP